MTGDAVSIRPARAQDAAGISRVLTASIRALCGADHGGDPSTIADWLANKTPEAVASWIASGARLRLAERGGRLAAVGGWRAAGRTGEILLLYVAPEHRFAGASAALLAAMEAKMAADGLVEARLESTLTARRFYAARGWRAPDPPGRLRAGARLTMTRRLSS